MIIRPRLNDYHDLSFTQEEVDFAIPFLDEDIPLYMDPFLLWKSPSQQDNALHGSITNSFNYLGRLYAKNEDEAVSTLKEISECDEVGLGNSKSKKGKKIGDKMARAILTTFKDIPHLQENGFTHLEMLQLLVEDFSKDRVSDISCNLVKSFLIDYTIQQSIKYSIPTENSKIHYFDNRKLKFVNESVNLPTNPNTKEPILLIPKRWLRFIPWINYEDFFKNHIEISKIISQGEKVPRAEILEFNRKNYDQLQSYIKRKQLEQKDCKNDPLFTQIPILSSKRKLKSITQLPTGKINNADQEYEKHLCPLLASMLYPGNPPEN